MEEKHNEPHIKKYEIEIGNDETNLMYHSSFARTHPDTFNFIFAVNRRSVSVELNNINGIINYSVLNQKTLKEMTGESEGGREIR